MCTAGPVGLGGLKCATAALVDVGLAWCQQPDYECDARVSGTPNCCLEHEIQTPQHEALPGGRLVIMDAKVPPGPAGRLIRPFGLWLMKRTMLGNPLIHPWQELGIVAEDVDMRECMFSSYYICSAMKPLVGAAIDDQDRPTNDNTSPDLAHRIAAE